MKNDDLFDHLDTITDGLVDFIRDEAWLLILEPDTGRKFTIAATDCGEAQACIEIDCRNLDSVFGCDAFTGDVVIQLDVDVFRHVAVVGSTEKVPVENRAELVNLQLAEISRYRRSPLAFIDRTPTGAQAKPDVIIRAITANHDRIAAAGYPTVCTCYEDDGETYIDWWVDEVGHQLEKAAQREWDETDDDEYLGLHSDAHRQHCQRIVAETIATLRKTDEPTDLLDLIDAAAKQGSAFIAENAAGHFLETIAKLAWKQIKQGGAHHG